MLEELIGLKQQLRDVPKEELSGKYFINIGQFTTKSKFVGSLLLLATKEVLQEVKIDGLYDMRSYTSNRRLGFCRKGNNLLGMQPAEKLDDYKGTTKVFVCKNIKLK